MDIQTVIVVSMSRRRGSAGGNILENYTFSNSTSRNELANFYGLPREKFWTGFLTPLPK
jgi:hypothetical protein